METYEILYGDDYVLRKWLRV